MAMTPCEIALSVVLGVVIVVWIVTAFYWTGGCWSSCGAGKGMKASGRTLGGGRGGIHEEGEAVSHNKGVNQYVDYTSQQTPAAAPKPGAMLTGRNKQRHGSSLSKPLGTNGAHHAVNNTRMSLGALPPNVQKMVPQIGRRVKLKSDIAVDQVNSSSVGGGLYDSLKNMGAITKQQVDKEEILKMKFNRPYGVDLGEHNAIKSSFIKK